jgi:hypothetical protein
MDENQMYIMGVMTIAHIQKFVQVKNLGKLCLKETWHNGLYPASSRFAQISEWAAKQAQWPVPNMLHTIKNW